MLRHILPIIVLVAGARIPHYRHSPRAPVERHLRDGSPVFEPVCLLQQSPQRLENPDPSLPAWNVTKKIVVYNALSTTTEIVPGNFGQEAGSVTAQFPVEFRKEKPPRNLSITDATALFVGATCEANIDHFVKPLRIVFFAFVFDFRDQNGAMLVQKCFQKPILSLKGAKSPKSL